MTARIAVLGSINMDLVIRAPRLPKPGETLLGAALASHPGGKGANQAVAAARLGATVSLIGCVGSDAHGRTLLDALAREGVDITHVREVTDHPTGAALITVDAQGENTIVVAPGANGQVSGADLDAAAEIIASADILVTQLEIPFTIVQQAIDLAHHCGRQVLLNAAPAQPLSEAFLQTVDLLVVNEQEARLIGGCSESDPSERLAGLLRERGRGPVVVTRGAKGVVSCNRVGCVLHQDAFAVKAVDSTAAGDAFCGALAVAVAEKRLGEELQDAIRFANAAGALSVTRVGAQASLPTRAEVEALLAESSA
ncbi:MAG: ribokinase [Phycisphaeraceae bacterium]|nr:MAG: ribokinase [Phycisphaeraceae bacterium]